jgi:hypothetical protein
MNQSTSAVAPAEPNQPRKQPASVRWRKLLEDQRVSGLPIAAFCRERGIPASSLFAWRRQLGLCPPRRLTVGASVFKPVKIAAATRASARHGGDDGGDAVGGAIEVHVAGDRRLVRPGFDRQLLAEVIGVLDALP